ncbi:unnamed protein product, partial [Closterium sp. NIES-53]
GSVPISPLGRPTQRLRLPPLQPFQKRVFTTLFYFPFPGSFSLFPAHLLPEAGSGGGGGGEGGAREEEGGADVGVVAVAAGVPASIPVLSSSEYEKMERERRESLLQQHLQAESSSSAAVDRQRQQVGGKSLSAAEEAAQRAELWEVICLSGSEPDILRMLQGPSLRSLDLALLLPLMPHAPLYHSVTSLLRRRKLFHLSIWQYSLLHQDPRGMSEYLAYEPAFLARLSSPVLLSSLLHIEPGAVGARLSFRYRLNGSAGVLGSGIGSGVGSGLGSVYEHEEFLPLLNPRAHRFGMSGSDREGRRREKRVGGESEGEGKEGREGVYGSEEGGWEEEPGVNDIWNEQLLEHYSRFLELCARRKGGMSAQECLAAAYYLLVQDRVKEAHLMFLRAASGKIFTLPDTWRAALCGGNGSGAPVGAGAAAPAEGAGGGEDSAASGVGTNTSSTSSSAVPFTDLPATVNVQLAADYMAAFLDILLCPTDRLPVVARAVAKKYRAVDRNGGSSGGSCPVVSWRKRFADLGKQVYEIWMAARAARAAGAGGRITVQGGVEGHGVAGVEGQAQSDKGPGGRGGGGGGGEGVGGGGDAWEWEEDDEWVLTGSQPMAVAVGGGGGGSGAGGEAGAAGETAAAAAAAAGGAAAAGEGTVAADEDMADVAQLAEAAEGDGTAVDPFSLKRSSGPKPSQEPFLEAKLLPRSAAAATASTELGTVTPGTVTAAATSAAAAAVVGVRYANVGSIRVDVFAFDAETFFSCSPFSLLSGAATAGGGAGSRASVKGGNGVGGPSSIFVAPNWSTVVSTDDRSSAAGGAAVRAGSGSGSSGSSSGSSGSLVVQLPSEFDSEAVLITVSSGALTTTLLRPVHESLVVEVVERLGQLRVLRHIPTPTSAPVDGTLGNGKAGAVVDRLKSAQGTLVPLPGAYVKVFFRPKSRGVSYLFSGSAGEERGGAVFYKDGYTDRRGWFDYAFVSTEDVEKVDMFAVLVTKEGAGSVVRHVKPPKV